MVERLCNGGYRASGGEKYKPTPGQRPVDGLEVLSGFCCPLLREDGSRCARAFGTEGSLSRHLSDHPRSPENKPSPSSCVSYVQILFRQGGLKSYFSVDPSLSNLDPSSTSAYAHAVEMLANMPKADIPVSDHDKERASIHWFTRWPQLLQPYVTDRASIEYLQSLVSFPDPDSDPSWLTKLLDHGARWWEDAEIAHVNCSYRVSTMLKSHPQ